MITQKNYKSKKISNQYTRFFDLKKLLPISKNRRDEKFSRETVFARPTKAPTQNRSRSQAVCEHYVERRGGPLQWRHTDNCVTSHDSEGTAYLYISESDDEQPIEGPVCYNVFHESNEKSPPKHQPVEPVISPLPRGIRISICVEHTRFPLVARVSKGMGLTHVPEHRLWNLQWCDTTPHFDLLKGMKRFQQINHFPGMSEICRKDMLALNLNRMFKMFPGDYRIFPKTWLLPSDSYDVAIYARKHRRTYILKPYSSGQGRGIWLTNNLRSVRKHEKLICQTYVEKPLLIDGFKFDLRIYTLVTSVDPLRIFVYNEGLARFATNKYMPPALGNSNNLFMHLTNYCVNRRNSNYNAGHGNEGGSKRKLREYNKWLSDHDYSVTEFWAAVDDAIIKTVISAWPVLKHNYHLCFPKHDQIQACFQLLGFDILVDWKLKPYILEVNHTPSLLSDETVDVEVKRPLIRDTLNLLSTPLVDKEEILREDRIKQRERLLRQQGRRQAGGVNQLQSNQNFNQKSMTNCNGKLKQACSISALAQQIAWEESHLGNYRRIMPPSEPDKISYYCKFYDQAKASNMFKQTEASRSRMRLNLEQLEQKRLQERLEKEKQQQQQSLLERQEVLKTAFDIDKTPTFSELRRQRCNALVMQDLKRKGMKFFAKDTASVKSLPQQLSNDLKSSIESRTQQSSKTQTSIEKNASIRLNLKRQMLLVKAQRNRRRYQMGIRARRARCIEWESRADAAFLEKYGMPASQAAAAATAAAAANYATAAANYAGAAAGDRLQGGSSMHDLKPPSSNKLQTSKSIRKLKMKTRKPLAKKVASCADTALETVKNVKCRTKRRNRIINNKNNWLPQPISIEEQQWQNDWRKQRTEDLNHWQLKEMLFGEMYKHGNLSKNDIKLFPFLLYRILEKKSELSADDDELLGQGSEPSVDN